jgi:type II secretory ATPase GspE/PulE/Tfp pilus assembly ATPase PilB-like protein
VYTKEVIQEINSFDNLQRPLGNEPGQISATDWVNLALTRALELNASDIHFDAGFGKFLARLRVDGVLQKIYEGPGDNFETVIARLKVISNLNSAEHRQPQEGHATVQVAQGAASQGDIDLRISIFPTIYGESAAIRILNRKDFLFDTFEDMGMTPQDAEMFRNTIIKPHGMILVTGPTGSGKSATIYTALNQIRSVEKNIVTLEDPVEYQMELVRQSQINNDIEYTFARGMRSILRQDPDVIMIGEIRDDETAEIAIRAALTGRLLFSTMHTNDSIGAVTRFVEFGIPRSFIATSILLVMAKRLIRKNCTSCTQAYVPAERILTEAGITDANAQFYKGGGCEVCSGTGYQGRTAIYEFFNVDSDIQQLIIENAPYSKLYESARSKGMKNLKEAAIELALSGQTTLEEALHVSA